MNLLKKRWSISVIAPDYILPGKSEPSDDRRKNICRLFARFGYKQISTRINFWYLMKRDSSFDSKESTWDMEISLADNYGPPPHDVCPKDGQSDAGDQ